MAEITWITIDVALAIHEEQISEHGGGEGLRDRGLLESALARPLNLAAYEAADLPALAAALGCGIARNHPFIDGNKRTAFVAVETFLGLNGFDLTADDANCVLTMLSVATGEMSEGDFAIWLRAHTEPRA
ncbi:MULTISPECIES: type II toxin-antitoxin system death-on-curing family toxin [Roseomonadaceae]|uniref:Type II toxin-antitoxin system death-on-curing family toxin n=1 Tax=Falsiroseomonas oleicola TaxID=2801474 RepID=A0ABS6H741_9PROT|nr:type II toxin-antitoxin system death-on-curing family toxin [Roseomonas oleicola]MBU8544503.1 type II toxin-antitoxin system death-on-curing family toxin [Roseomonas oleicola]